MLNPSIITNLATIAAAGNSVDVAETVSTGFTEIYNQIVAVANPIGTVAVAICGLYLLLGSDPGYIKKAKSWGISIFFGILVINFAPSLVSWALNALK